MKENSYWFIWKEKVTLDVSHTAGETLAISEDYPLSEGKVTHVFLSHDWGINKRNHEIVKQVGEALKNRGLKVWIDDDDVDEFGNKRITTHLDDAIAKAIEGTECMLAFITRRYISKVNGDDVTDYCKKELAFGLDELKKRVIPVIVDSMVQLPLKGTIKFKFPDVFYHDMRAIFDSSILLSDKETSENIDELFKRIVTAIQLPQKSSQINREDDNFASTPSILSSANNKKRHKKKREEITHDKEAEDPSTERQETKNQEVRETQKNRTNLSQIDNHI